MPIINVKLLEGRSDEQLKDLVTLGVIYAVGGVRKSDQ